MEEGDAHTFARKHGLVGQEDDDRIGRQRLHHLAGGA